MYGELSHESFRLEEDRNKRGRLYRVVLACTVKSI